MRPTLNLASRTYVNRRALLTLYSLLTAAAVLAVCTLGIYFVRLQGQYRQISGYLAEVEGEFRKLKGGDAPPADPRQVQAVQDQVVFANELLTQDSFSWIELLDHLEEVTPDGVGIQSIQPNFKEKSLQLSCVGMDVGKLQAFIDRLMSSPHFGEVFLLGQSQTEMVSPRNEKRAVVTFSLVVKEAF